MHWEYKNKKQPSQTRLLQTKSNIDQNNLLDELLDIRGYTTKKEKENFLNPPKPQDLTLQDFGIDQKEVDKAITRIKQVIEKGEHIIIYGDYDVDGVSGTAILWETLYRLTPNVLPYLPERISEGYGFNLESVKKQKAKNNKLKLVITVDQGVTAGDKFVQVKKELGIDVIVCDHHELPKEKIPCEALIHTNKVCATAIAWVFSREIKQNIPCHSVPGHGIYTNNHVIPDLIGNLQNHHIDSHLHGNDKEDVSKEEDNTLELVALATIADLEPLTGINRSLAKYGLETLNKTKRPGLINLIKQAGIELGKVGTYEVGYILAPRINAMGRMRHAIEALRLLCTKKEEQALELAKVLDETNRDRQSAMEEIFQHSRNLFLSQHQDGKLPKFILVAHESYQEGVIGLAAGKLTEEFHRPSAVISIGEFYSKASARSINGFNIIEVLREHFDLITEAGGHPMAAGFTLETSKVGLLQERLIAAAEKSITDEMLEKALKIDMEIPLSAANLELYQDICQLAPFGIGNPEPIFSSEAELKDMRTVGNEGKHLKLSVSDNGRIISVIAFNQGDAINKLKLGSYITLAYNLSLNQWNGHSSIELKTRDIQCQP